MQLLTPIYRFEALFLLVYCWNCISFNALCHLLCGEIFGECTDIQVKYRFKKKKFCHRTVWNENKSLRLGFDFNRRWCVIFAIFRRHYTSTSKISNLSHWIRQRYSKIANCSLFCFLENILCRPKCQSKWKSIGFFVLIDSIKFYLYSFTRFIA